MSADTSTMVATGRMSPNTSACTAPTSRHREMSVTNMRVRTTSDSDAPASCSAVSMRRKASRAWAAMSSPAPVVPATAMYGPMRTARE